MPRRAAPRPRVPAGSVAMAGRLTGVYPFASPGGWNLIGRTERVLFDPFASEPALIQAGDRVRFLASDLPVDADYPRTQPFPASMPVIEVVDGGTAHDRAGRRTAGPSPAGRAVVRLPGSAGRARREPRRRQHGERRPPRMHGQRAHAAFPRHHPLRGDGSRPRRRPGARGPRPLARPERTRGRGAPRQRPLHARPPVGAARVRRLRGRRHRARSPGVALDGPRGRLRGIRRTRAQGQRPPVAGPRAGGGGGGRRASPRRRRARSCCARWPGPRTTCSRTRRAHVWRPRPTR